MGGLGARPEDYIELVRGRDTTSSILTAGLSSLLVLESIKKGLLVVVPLVRKVLGFRPNDSSATSLILGR